MASKKDVINLLEKKINNKISVIRKEYIELKNSIYSKIEKKEKELIHKIFQKDQYVLIEVDINGIDVEFTLVISNRGNLSTTCRIVDKELKKMEEEKFKIEQKENAVCENIRKKADNITDDIILLGLNPDILKRFKELTK